MKVAQSVAEVVRYGAFLKDKLQLSDEQQAPFDAINGFAKSYVDWLETRVGKGNGPRAELRPEHQADVNDAMVWYAHNAREMVEQYDKLVTSMEQIQRLGQAVLALQSLSFVQDNVRNSRTVSQELAELGDAPEVTKELFKDVTVISSEDTPAPGNGEGVEAGENGGTPEGGMAPSSEGAGEAGESPADAGTE
jgi:hypothetical protein